MLVALIAKDKPGSLEIRKANREAHLEHLKTGGVRIALAGPLLDDDGAMIGSLLVLDVENREQAQDWADRDPYARAGLFGSVEMHGWNKVVG